MQHLAKQKLWERYQESDQQKKRPFSAPVDDDASSAMDADDLFEEERFQAAETASVDVPMAATNVGYKLLQKMGWKQGQGLGSAGQGRVEPVPFEVKQDALGIGRGLQERQVAESTTSKRKAMDSEKQQQETDEQRLEREAKVMKRAEVEEELKQVKQAFYCDLCDKQYNRVSEYDQHLQSYDHHHRKRLKDMKHQMRRSDDTDKQREKEKKREERDMQRIQKAMNMQKQPAAVPTSSPSSSIATTTNTATSDSTPMLPKSGPVKAFSLTTKGPAKSFTITSKKIPMQMQSSSSTIPTTSTSATASPSAPVKVSFGLGMTKRPMGMKMGMNRPNPMAQDEDDDDDDDDT